LSTIMSSAARDSPSPQHHPHSHHHQPHPSTSTPRSSPATPQPPFPTNTTTTAKNNNNNDIILIHQEDEEHASLINEILRLERSMNGALRASRDEMESLNKISADKKAAVKQMGEVLDMMKTGSSTTSSNNNRSLHRGPPSSSNSSPSRRRTISTSSNNNTAMGESHLRKSVIHPNWNRRVSVSGDRPFFRRRATEAPPPLKDELAELRENFRRRSDPAQPDPSSFIPSRVLSRQSSKQGSMRSSIMNRSLSILNLNQNCNDGDSSSSSSSSNESDSQKNNHSNNGEDNDTTNQEEMIHYQTTLESKNQQLAQLQKQQVSNSNQQSYLQSKLQSIQTQSRSRLVQHTSIVEGLHSRKQTLAKTVQRRERLITEVEGCLEGYGERIDLLEKEIESKTNASQQKSVRHPLPQQDATDIRNSNNRKAMTVSDLEEEIRKYRMRQKIHSQYTAKALESFLNSMDMAKKKDTAGILFKNDQAKGEGSEEKRQHLIEGIFTGCGYSVE